LWIGLVVAAMACAGAMALMESMEADADAPAQAADERSGLASWYGGGEPLQTHVAMGHRFDPDALEAAMWDMPFGSAVRVTNLENGRSVVVRVTDRGPARRLDDRIIELTRASCARIAPLEQGLVRVRVERLF